MIVRPTLAPALGLAIALVGTPCAAQTAAGSASAERTERGEPSVRHIVVEDDGARIDELRVRGQTQRVVVSPKMRGAASYEIIVGRSGREASDGTGGATGAAGKRVWSVLKF